MAEFMATTLASTKAIACSPPIAIVLTLPMLMMLPAHQNSMLIIQLPLPVTGNLPRVGPFFRQY